MDNTRITIPLERTEKSALMKLAIAELRDPATQARFILRRELERLGFLQPALTAPKETANGNGLHVQHG